MKKIIFIILLFYTQLNSAFAQQVANPDSIIYKPLECFEPNRKLPVFYFEEGKNTKIVTDTFWIWNTTKNDIPVYLNPYYHQDWKMPSVVKANSKPPLVYYKEFENFDGYYLPLNLNARIEYGNTHLTVTLYTQLLHKNATMKKMQDGSLQFLIPLDSVKHNYLYTFPNGIMKEAGCKLNADSSKIGGITVKAKFGEGYDVEYHGKNFSFELMNAAINECKLYYNYLGDARDYQIFVNGNPFNYTFPSNANQVKIVKDSSSITYPLVSGENNRTIPLYLLQPNEPYRMLNNIKHPVDYKHHQYAVFYWAKEPHSESTSINLHHYKNKYPELNIHTIGFKTVFDTEHLSETARQQILQNLEQDEDVRCVIKLITKTDGKSNFQIFDNSIYTVMPTTVDQENLKEKVKQFDFEYISTQAVSSYTHFFRYKNKVWDEKAMQQFNELYKIYPYYDFKFNFYIIAEPNTKFGEKQSNSMLH